MQRKAIIYARTSRDDDSPEGTKSIPDQVADCEALCEREGYKVVGVFKEPNRSGRLYPTGYEEVFKLDIPTVEFTKGRRKKTRDQLGQAFKMLRKADVLVARDIERIGRPLSDSLLLNWLPQQFKQFGVTVHTVRDGISDPDDFGNRLAHTIQQMVVDREIRKRTQHSKEKLRSLKDDGYVAHDPTVFGYQSAGRQKVIIVEEQAAIVKRIFELAAVGRNWSAIARKLNAEQETEKWRSTRIIQIIDRPEYFGHCYNTKGRLIKSKVYPTLVDDVALFRELQRKRKANAKRHGGICAGIKKPRPLSGLLKCGFCGAPLYLNLGTKGPNAPDRLTYYICSRPHRVEDGDESKGCRMVRIREDQLIDFLATVGPLAVRRNQTPESKGPEEVKAEIEKATAKRDGLLQKENALYDREDDLSAAQFARQAARLASRIDEAETTIAQLTNLATADTQERIPLDEFSSIHSLVSEIRVCAFTVEIDFSAGETLRLERVPLRNGRHLPPAECILPEGFPKSEAPIEIRLQYKTAIRAGDRTESVLLSSPGLRVIAIGSNPKFGEERKRRGWEVKMPPAYVLESRPIE